MKNEKKAKFRPTRGFTLVELVIVIAVIAILAAVLIPTFAGVVDGANESADIQLVAELNTALSTEYGAADQATAENLRKLLKEDGVEEVSTKKSDDLVLYDRVRNKFELFDVEDLNIVGPSTSSEGTMSEEDTLVIDETPYSPEEIFKNYIVASTSGNPLSSALYALHNLPRGDLEGETKAQIEKAFDMLEKFPAAGLVKAALKDAVNTCYYVAEDGAVAKFYVKDDYAAAEWKNGDPALPIKTRVVFDENLNEFRLRELADAIGDQYVPTVLPSTLSSIELPAELPAESLEGVLLMGDTSKITAEQKSVLSGQIYDLSMAKIREELAENGPLIRQPQFTVTEHPDAEKWEYADLNDALADAEKSAKLSGLDRSVVLKADATIDEDVTIAKHVTLFLPYDAQTDGSQPVTYAENGTAGLDGTVQSDWDDLSAAGNDGMCDLTVTVADGVSIVNEGTIAIGGITTGGNDGKRGAGQTVLAYAKLVLGKDSVLTSRGKVEAFGFLEEAEQGNGARVVLEGGTLRMPFVVVEHRGASVFAAMAGGYAAQDGEHWQAAPFNRFYLENVLPPLTVTSGAEVIGRINLSANGEDAPSDLKLLGGSADDMIQLAEGSSAEARFRRGEKYNINSLTTYGSWQFNPITFSVAGVPFDTASTFFPLSNHWNVALEAKEGEAATVDLTRQDVKLYPGANLSVGENVTVSAKQIIVYDSSHNDPAPALKYPTTSGAMLTVYGTLNASALGGPVVAGSDGAILTVGTAHVEAKELSGVTGDEYFASATWKTFPYDLTLDTLDGQTNDPGSYVAESGRWKSRFLD